MIYILTGIAKAGKTFVANKIRKRYDISVFSTDYIMMMLHKGNKDLNIDIHASDSSVAKKIEPYVYGLVETMVENDENYLIEGVHFNTDFSKKLKNKFGDKICILYLGYKNISAKDKLEEIYKYKEQMDNPWIFYSEDQVIEEIVSYLIDESKRIYNECTELGFDYFEVSDINLQAEDIVKKLMCK